MTYPVIMNGDHAEFEAEHANTKPEDRPDWPLPSFDARDWAKAFCKTAAKLGYKRHEGHPIDEEWMVGWFANALMRGFDERASRLNLVAWRSRHGHGKWEYSEQRPEGPSAHLFETEALFND